MEINNLVQVQNTIIENNFCRFITSDYIIYVKKTDVISFFIHIPETRLKLFIIMCVL